MAGATSNAEDASESGCSHLDSEQGPLQLARFRDMLLNKTGNPHSSLIDGSGWPPNGWALSMAGQRRLDSFSALVATAVEDGVPGHVIETGVWRGGMSFMAAKTLELLGASAAGRLTYLADSFRGIPNQVTYKPAIEAFRPKHTKVSGSDVDVHSHTYEILNNNNVQRVMKDAQAVGLDMSRLRFVEGYFNDSLPALIRAEPAIQFAVVRLDGDTYFSTYEAIEILYPHLSPDGFLIVDDYLDWKTCRAAIDTYRTVHGIKEPIVAVPHNSTEIVRGVYWRKSSRQPQVVSNGDGALSKLSPCAGCPQGSLRPAGALLRHGEGSRKPVSQGLPMRGALRGELLYDLLSCAPVNTGGRQQWPG
jgi:hypothetical protein